MMRFNWRPDIGQIWQTSDPRRMSAFRVIKLAEDAVLVMTLYPKRTLRTLHLMGFATTGTKGYTRIS